MQSLRSAFSIACAFASVSIAVLPIFGDPSSSTPLFDADPAATFIVERHLVEPAMAPTKPYSVHSFRVPTAAPSGDATNDVIPGRDYVPAGESRGSVVILPIWYGPKEGGLEDVAARYLATRGFRAFVLPMAWQWERQSDGGFPGILSGDLDRTRQAMIQSVKDARRVAALLDRDDGGRGRVGILGISLGGFVGALTFGVAPEFRAGVFALAGAGVSDVLLHPSSETQRVIDDLRRRGVSPDEVRRRCRDFDPATYAKPERGERLLLFAGMFDEVVQPASVERLAKAFGDVTIRWAPGGHITSALFYPDFLESAERHFGRWLAEPTDGAPARAK
ncbi:MAG: prolyl oligopeptidase family serine peptidase [Planctomycetes bacterium]|nr:prolyl oligopeptidase family serine peptidase [Planctomycetota bacterium]MBI3846437.1 prolyl oligopeptidase family serine peptidase [Planctomycetota bacterium]